VDTDLRCAPTGSLDRSPFALLPAACVTDDIDADEDTATDVSGTDPQATADASASAGEGPSEVPPTDTDALQTWLEQRAYDHWSAESAIHPSQGPHGGDVRTFVNAALLGSLEADADEHPIDAATVKELYDDDDVVGWAMMVKVVRDTGGDGWFWYERVGTSVYADGVGVELCSDCHQAGTDQILTPFPLQ